MRTFAVQFIGMNAKEVVPEPTEGVLTNFALGRDSVYAEVQSGFNTRVRRYVGGSVGRFSQGVDVAPGLAGSTFIAHDPAAAFDDAWLVTSTWTEPSRLMIASPKGVTRDTGRLVNSRSDATGKRSRRARGLVSGFHCAVVRPVVQHLVH